MTQEIFNKLENGELGKYNLNFLVNSMEEAIETKEVEVVHYVNDRMPVIIVKRTDGELQDFYYNDLHGAWKILTYNDGDDYYDFTLRESWIEEEIRTKVPDEFRNYVPKPFNWDLI